MKINLSQIYTQKKCVIQKIQLAKILAKLPKDQYAEYFEMQDDEEAFLVMHGAFRECVDALQLLKADTNYHNCTITLIMNDLSKTIQADYDLQSKRLHSQTEEIAQDRAGELTEGYNSLFFQLKDYYSLFITSLVFGENSVLSDIEPTVNQIWKAIKQGMEIEIKKPLFRLKDYKGNA